MTAVRAMKDECLSPTQRKVKRPRRVIYDKDKAKQQKARHIIELYVVCKLGYSPIRHIMNLPNDKFIEDVIRQHMLGRSGVDGSIGELYCPVAKVLDPKAMYCVKSIVAYYHTQDDPYVKQMLSTGTWKDDPVRIGPKTCKSCGKELKDEWNYCPFCNTKI